MKIVVLNGSPAGRNSITLYTVLYIKQHFPIHEYEIIHVGKDIRKLEKTLSDWQESLRDADLMGKPVGYLVDGVLDEEPNLRMLMEARSQVGGNTLAGIACSARDPEQEIDRLAHSLCYIIAKNYNPPKDFYGVGGLKIFRDLIWQMQGLMREDHRFYKEHGFYDFPQKQRGKMLAMYLVGELMNNPKLRKKAGGKLTEGMIGPYRKVLEQQKKEV
jgi:hypothetical protein